MSFDELKSFIVRLNPWYSYPEQIVLLDETSKDGRDALRRYGWAPKGQQALSLVPFSRGKRVSIDQSWQLLIKKGFLHGALLVEHSLVEYSTRRW